MNHHVEGIVSRPLQSISQRSTRRGFLGLTARLAFAATGIVVARHVPLPLIGDGVETAEASSHCTPCQWCGLCGRPCGGACGGSSSACPAGTTQGSFWAGCCCPIGGAAGFLYYYYDCCKPKSGGVCPSQCSVSKCFNHCPQSTWCTADQPCYFCTIAVAIAAC